MKQFKQFFLILCLTIVGGVGANFVYGGYK